MKKLLVGLLACIVMVVSAVVISPGVNATDDPPQNYILSVDVRGPGHLEGIAGVVIPTPTSFEIPAGEEMLLLPEVESSNEVFIEWQDETGSPLPLSPAGGIVVTQDITAIAVFGHQVSTTTFGNGTATPIIEKFEPGETANLAATADPGWVFDRWEIDNWSIGTFGSRDQIAYENPIAVIVDKSITGDAYFTDSPNLDIEIVGAGTVTPANGPYPLNTSFDLVATPNVGWMFLGWHGSITGSSSPYPVVMDRRIGATATFLELFDIDFSQIGLGDIFVHAPGSILANNLTIAIDEDFNSGTLNGWTTSATGLSAYDFYADFDASTATASLSRSHTGTNAVYWVRYRIVDGSDPLNRLYFHFHFNNWSNLAGVRVKPNEIRAFHTVSGSTTTDLNEVFSHDSSTWYQLRVHVNDGIGEVWHGVVGGPLALLTTMPLSGIPAPTLFHMSANQGHFHVDDILAVDYDSQDLTVSPTSLTYPDGTDFVVEPIGAPGWDFLGWVGDISGTESAYPMNVDGDYSVGAEFEYRTINLTIEQAGDGDGTLSPAAGTYTLEPGNPVRMIADVNPGSRFIQWSDGDTNPTRIVVPTVDATLTASIYKEHSLTTAVRGNGTIVDQATGLAPGALYTAFSTTTLEALPDPGYRFSHWSGAVNHTNPTAEMTIAQATDVTAVFVADGETSLRVWVGNGRGVPTFAPSPTHSVSIDVVEVDGMSWTVYDAVYPNNMDIDIELAEDAQYPHEHWTTQSGLSIGHEPSITIQLLDTPSVSVFTQPGDDAQDYTRHLSLDMMGEGFVLESGLRIDAYENRLSESLHPLGVELHAVAASGWTFERWYNNLGHLLSNGASVYSIDATDYADVDGDGAVLPADIDFIETAFSGGDISPLVADINGDGVVDLRDLSDGHSALHHHMLSARFVSDTVVSLNHTVLPVEGGYVVDSGNGTYASGETASIAAVPAEGYDFAGWSGDLSGTESFVTLTMDGTKNITASFVTGDAPTVTIEGDWDVSLDTNEVYTDPGVTVIDDDSDSSAITVHTYFRDTDLVDDTLSTIVVYYAEDAEGHVSNLIFRTITRTVPSGLAVFKSTGCSGPGPGGGCPIEVDGGQCYDPRDPFPMGTTAVTICAEVNGASPLLNLPPPPPQTSRMDVRVAGPGRGQFKVRAPLLSCSNNSNCSLNCCGNNPYDRWEHQHAIKGSIGGPISVTATFELKYYDPQSRDNTVFYGWWYKIGDGDPVVTGNRTLEIGLRPGQGIKVYCRTTRLGLDGLPIPPGDPEAPYDPGDPNDPGDPDDPDDPDGPDDPEPEPQCSLTPSSEGCGGYEVISQPANGCGEWELEAYSDGGQFLGWYKDGTFFSKNTEVTVTVGDGDNFELVARFDGDCAPGETDPPGPESVPPTRCPTCPDYDEYDPAGWGDTSHGLSGFQMLSSKKGLMVLKTREEGAPIGARLANGEFTRQENDIHLAGRGFDFNWSRVYQSVSGENTAQGNGWNHSYDYRLERVTNSEDLIFHHGNGRHDRMRRRLGGHWRLLNLPMRTELEANGEYSMRFVNGMTYTFNPLNESAPSASDGKIASMTDRNGNMMTFAYNGQGQLISIVDTLGREIVIEYGNGKITRVATPISGLEATYTYYGSGDPEGNPGDLKTVRNPENAISEYPTRYTYTVHSSDPKLSSNLVSAYDGEDRELFRNQYSFVTEPDHLSYDKLIRQHAFGGVTDVTYLKNGVAINDRLGRVSVIRYAANNSPISRTDYGIPAHPMLGSNPETNYNMPSTVDRDGLLEAPVIESEFQFNDAGTDVIAISQGSGSTRVSSSMSYHPDHFQSNGGLSFGTQPSEFIARDADGQEIYRINFEFGENNGCSSCPASETTAGITEYTDGNGNTWSYNYADGESGEANNGDLLSITHLQSGDRMDFAYNAYGQLTQRTWPSDENGYRRVDAYSYTGGYLSQATKDINGLNLTWTYVNDAMGRVIAVSTPEGHVTTFAYDIAGRTTHVTGPPIKAMWPSDTSAGDVNGDGHLNSTDYQIVLNTILSGAPHPIYDTDVNGDGATNSQDLQFISNVLAGTLDEVQYETSYAYDDSGRVAHVSTANYVDGVRDSLLPTLNKFFDYDMHGQVAAIREIVSDAEQVATQFHYDESGAMTTVAHGVGAVGGSQPTNAVSVEYNGFGKIKTLYRGGGLEQTEYGYDYQKRLVYVNRDGLITRYAYSVHRGPDQVTMPDGTSIRYAYDANENLTARTIVGQYAEGSAYRALSHTVYHYDYRDLVIQIDQYIFDPAQASATAPPSSAEVATTKYTYDAAGHLVALENPQGAVLDIANDSLGRPHRVTDPLGNYITYEYDRDGNVVERRVADVHGHSAPEIRTTTYEYDALGRVIRRVYPDQSNEQFAYNTNGQVTTYTDRASNDPNLPGDISQMIYDALGRLIETRRPRDGVSGAYTHTMKQTYDASSRLLSRVDASGNATSYSYDALDRLVNIDFADDSSTTFSYGNDPLLYTMTQSAGSESRRLRVRLDPMGRVASRTILDDWGLEEPLQADAFRYNGLGQIVRAFTLDNATDDFEAAEDVLRHYDSLGRVLSETVGAYTTQYQYNLIANNTNITYPGGRSVSRNRDLVGRLSSVAAAGLPQTYYGYKGHGRLAYKTTQDGGQQLFTAHYTRDPATGRTINSTIAKADGSNWDARSYSHAPNGNVTRWQDLLSPAVPGRDFIYDDMDRLIHSETIGGTDPVDYTRDFMGNRQSVSGGQDPGPYTMTPGAPAYDAPLHLYTTTPSSALTHDFWGNLATRATGSDTEQYKYDFNNRMVEHVAADGSVTRYRYDALGRRTHKTVEHDTATPITTQYLYSGWQVIEERDDTGGLLREYVFGRGIDERLAVVEGPNTRYFHYDAQGNVVALSDEASVLERYAYDDYGTRAVFDAAWTPIGASALGNPYGFQGRPIDEETGFYYYRYRYYDPVQGRFTTRDPIGLWGDPTNHGHGYAYTAHNPWTYHDPYGLELMGYDDDTVDTAQDIIGLGGFIPVIGAPIDIANGMADLKQGQYVEAGVNFIGVIPVAGEGVQVVYKGGKWIVRLAADGIQAVGGACKVGDNAADASKAAKKAADGLDNLHFEAHHPDPEFIGGASGQPKVDLPRDSHKEFHSDYNEHLYGYTNESGNHMRPQRGNSGRDIRNTFNRAELLEATCEFYDDPDLDDIFKASRDQFYKQNPGWKDRDSWLYEFDE